ncbi:MAG: cytochrome c [Candidatus Rokubacteria bacterium]|nr:cytochrome c [Candidatus Rokubacteria bacterium]
MIARRRPFQVGAVALAILCAVALGTAGRAQEKWKAPAEAKQLKNPLPKSDKVLAQAKKVFETNCVACHGPKGLGDGPAAAALPVKPANWTAAATQAESDGELFWKISNGRGPMPPWKHLPENDRWAMVQFIRTLKK